MDLLLVPADPAFPTDDTPYLAGDKRWEHGHFPTYAGCGHISIIANLKTLTREGLNGFLQRWLFFGLAAEFLGLNEQEDGTYIIDPSQAEYELGFLYENSLVLKEDGDIYITGVSILALVPIIQQRIVAALSEGSP
ncbi:hypothetical protein VMCG_03900 [Cytospora schulzeri]|uniref:Uncharacterized protein n=1 Tax=Cytospora schulzeri TaxID=448051 RepID=A0A423WV14_9PEZI|nr:hypothetical protein VMCG_03900 [Valsa malicola]